MGKIASTLLTAIMFFGVTTVATAQEGSAASLYNSALEKLKAEDFKSALSLLYEAVEKADPEADAEVIKLAQRNGAIAAYKAGNEYRREKKADEALAAFDKGIEFSSGFYANYIGRAQALEDKGENVEAVKAYLLAGDVSDKSKKADKAAELYSKAENFAALAYGDKKWDDAIALAETFLAQRETADIHFYLSSALKEKGQGEKAVEHAQKAVDLAQGGDTGKYVMALAEGYELLGQKDKALGAYKQITGGKYAERAQYKVKELSGGR